MASLALAWRSGCDTTLDIRNTPDSAAGAWRAPEEQHSGSSPPQFPGSVVRTMAANPSQSQYVGSLLQGIELVKFPPPACTESTKDPIWDLGAA